jgi:hypothetical protein
VRAGTVHESAKRPRSKQSCFFVCVQLECREVGSALNNWSAADREVSGPEDTMGWLNDCVTTSVKGASSPRMYIVGTKRKSRGEGEGKLAGSSGVLSKTE